MSKGPVHAMAISPHPADNDFGVGGTVAKWIEEGKEVVYVIATNGDKASSDPNVPADELAVRRANEQREAAKILGVTEVVFMGHPDLDAFFVSWPFYLLVHADAKIQKGAFFIFCDHFYVEWSDGSSALRVCKYRYPIAASFDHLREVASKNGP